ncbi:hypothetical protein PT286_09175 [Neisseriaceae bacterium ESL0693]|nr:hypothetical protein [Neisseriaceae bacterium ESL0693]
MKNIIKVACLSGILFSLYGCGTDTARFERQLKVNGYSGSTVTVRPANGYAQPPAQYLIDEQGHYIDKNGNRVDQPVENPYYQDYIRQQRR